MAVAMDSA